MNQPFEDSFNSAKDSLCDFGLYLFGLLFCGIIYHRFSGNNWLGDYPLAPFAVAIIMAASLAAWNDHDSWQRGVRISVPLFFLFLFYFQSPGEGSFIELLQYQIGFAHIFLLVSAVLFAFWFTAGWGEELNKDEIRSAELRRKEAVDGLSPERAFDRIVGQEHVIEPIKAIAKVAKSGIRVGKRNAPHAVLLFLGPTGVGKTEAANALAEAVFGSKNALIRFDMGQFSDAHQANRFYGPPPGYVGYEEGGQLTRAVLKRPRSLVLLDEVEKAHPKIWDAFLPVFDEGYIVDGSTNQRIDMTETVIVLTSNLLVEREDLYNLNAMELKEAIINTGAFRPELLGRINEVLAFKPLTHEAKAEILKRRLDAALWSLAEQGISLIINEEDIEIMLQEVETAKFGVRQIDDIVRKFLRQAITERSGNS